SGPLTVEFGSHCLAAWPEGGQKRTMDVRAGSSGQHSPTLLSTITSHGGILCRQILCPQRCPPRHNRLMIQVGVKDWCLDQEVHWICMNLFRLRNSTRPLTKGRPP